MGCHKKLRKETSPILIKKRPSGDIIVLEGYTTVENPNFAIDLRCPPKDTGEISTHFSLIFYNSLGVDWYNYGTERSRNMVFYQPFDFKLRQQIKIEINTRSGFTQIEINEELGGTDLEVIGCYEYLEFYGDINVDKIVIT
ncbi:uncharacterized protein LOC131937286 [Physella acuta]|uniref:uncharacterized protein LOC131937286 n=1 Tax=Physella acuta TaxID=109671 RepID=UPI0027DB9F58|nr:uncharacterized protein LOC131937286 [Physella acuta]